jgi:dihydrodipicolinate synthase/N-acetylneuraminate lyase
MLEKLAAHPNIAAVKLTCGGHRPMEHRWYQDQGKIGPVLVGGLNLDQDVAGGAITDFFEEVADRAPIPIVIYNFPNLLSGLDVNSDMYQINW